MIDALQPAAPWLALAAGALLVLVSTKLIGVALGAACVALGAWLLVRR